MKDVTLVFLRREGELLLAMKKRGFGEGKWNGAGGKVEAGEAVEAAAIRECQEEIGVTPRNLTSIGTIEFLMSTDASFGHRAHIFSTTVWEGEPHETEEMRPQWFAENSLPYDQMWSDDIYWIPLLLAGTRFAGSVTLDDNDNVVMNTIAPLI